jgi:hypothetical protein
MSFECRLRCGNELIVRPGSPVGLFQQLDGFAYRCGLLVILASETIAEDNKNSSNRLRTLRLSRRILRTSAFCITQWGDVLRRIEQRTAEVWNDDPIAALQMNVVLLLERFPNSGSFS